MPSPQPRARPSRRPRRMPEAKCSWAIVVSPRCQRSPSSRRYGRITSASIVSTVVAASAWSIAAWARGSSNEARASASSARRVAGEFAGAGAGVSSRRARAAPPAGARPAGRGPRPRRARAAPAPPGGGQAGGQVAAHAPDAVDVGPRVEAQPARGALRLEQPVTAFPGAQQLGAHAGALAQLADPQDTLSGHTPDYTPLVQGLDKGCV